MDIIPNILCLSSPLSLLQTTDVKLVSVRDAQAAVFISFLLVVMGFIVAIPAAVALLSSHEPDSPWAMVVLSAVSLQIWVVLASFKLKLAHKLNSSALKKDAIVSGVVSVGTLSPCWWFFFQSVSSKRHSLEMTLCF